MVRGLVVAVDAASLIELRSIDVQDETGFTWHFEATGYPGVTPAHRLTPSHLREHMVQGLPATVKYHREDGVLVVDEITD